MKTVLVTGTNLDITGSVLISKRTGLNKKIKNFITGSPWEWNDIVPRLHIYHFGELGNKRHLSYPRTF